MTSEGNKREEKMVICPKCKSDDHFMVIKGLERHDENFGEGYEVLECYKCHAWFKAYWKLEKIIEMGEVI